MSMKTFFYCLIVSAIFLTYGLCPAMAQESRKFKVLVVMSYDEELQWCEEIKKAIDFSIGKLSETRYFYMDTKNHPEGGPQKAKEAYAIYQDFQPDGVIAADDHAQSMFVVPYLKDQVKTPVIFCGVNSEPDTYGYPSSNISGILERTHTAESIALAQQLVPSIKTFGGIETDSPTGKAYADSFGKKSRTYSAKLIDFKLPETIKEAIAMTEELKEKCDLLFMGTMKGIPDEDGRPLTEKESIRKVSKAFGKATFGNVAHGVTYGILCAVVQTGWEQGETAANMLLKAMRGTPVSQIPITQNHQGKRMINVTVMKELGIKPRPIVLQGAELVKTE